MRAASASDYREIARRRLPKFLFEYIDGGSYDEVTLEANRRDLRAIALRQRVLRDVSAIDTSVAHLCGAMGAKTWVLVAHAPDWRYHLEREDNPWYPGMRLFRQPRDGDWDGAIAALAAALGGLVRT